MEDSQKLLLSEWGKIKSVVDQFTTIFFNNYATSNVDQASQIPTSHELKNKKIHSCIASQLKYRGVDGKWEITLYWVVCEKCESKERRKYVIAWNNLDNVAYEKELLKPLS